MEVYNTSGKTKSGELSVTRAIGALLITSSRSVSALTNERISIHVERANASNLEICKDVSLKQFVLASAYGNSMIKSDKANNLGFSAICEIAINGSIPLAANERIKISLTGLVAAENYSINGIPYPVAAEQIYRYERKTLLNDELSRELKVPQSTLVVISNFDKIEEIEQTFENGQRDEYDNKELSAIAFDVEAVIGVDVSGDISTDTGNNLILSLEAVDVIELQKQEGTVELLFQY